MPGPSSRVGGGYLSLRPFSQALTGTIDKARDQRIEDAELKRKQETHELSQIKGYSDFYDDIGTSASQGSTAINLSEPIQEVNFNLPQEPDKLRKKQYIAGETEALVDGNIDGKLVHDNSDTKGFSMTELSNNFAFETKSKINSVVSDKNLSPREKALGISQAKQSIQQFSQAKNTLMQGAQKYLSDLAAGKVSKFTDPKTADFWNTLASGKARWTVEDGNIVGQTLSGDPIRQPISDLSQLPKWHPTSLNLDKDIDDISTKLGKETREIPDPDRPGVTITTKGFTDDKRETARNYFNTLLPDKKALGEAAVDYLGMDPFSVQENLRNMPEKTREAILDKLTERVGGQVGPPVAASSKTDQAIIAANAQEDQYFQRTRFNERNNPKPGSGATPSDIASDIASNLENPAYWGSKKIDGKQVAKSGIKEGVLTLKLITGTSKGEPVTRDVKYNLRTSDGVEKLARETGADSAVIQELKSIIGYEQSEKLPTNSQVLGGGSTQSPGPAQSSAAKRAADLIAKHRG